MTLVEILRQLTAADGRATRELPRGLHLVYYPALTNAAGEPVSRARLIAGRHVAVPSITELRVVRDALLEALDTHPTRVVVGLDEEWRDVVERNDWNGYAITWHMLPIGQAFGDTDQAGRIRRALEQREERADERRRHSQRSGRRPAANRGPEPML